MHRTTDIVLPSAIESEMAILSAMLRDTSCIPEILAEISPAEFHDGRHRAIMQAIESRHRAGEPIDIPAIAVTLNGHASYISRLMDHPAAIDIPYHIRPIREAAAQRHAMAAASKLLHTIPHADPDEVRRVVSDAIDSLSALRDEQHRASTGDRGFRLMPVGEIEMRPPEWLIPGMIERDTIIELFGDPASGKSLLVIDIAACISTRKDFHGRAVLQGAVVYIAGEGQAGIGRRFRAWAIRWGMDLTTAPLLVSLIPAALTDPASVDQVAAAIDAAAAQHGPPVMIVIDTLARNYGPADENSTQDMTRFIAACDRLRERYRAAVLIVHHTGHGDKSRARGSIALRGAVDTEYRLDRDTSGVCRLEALKMKDAEHPDPMAFVIRQVELPIVDDDGMPVTSAILDDADYDAPEPGGKTGRGKWQTIALDILVELHAEHRQRLESSGYNPEQARVAVDEWRVACLDRGMSRQAYHRVRQTLADQGAITEEHGYVRI